MPVCVPEDARRIMPDMLRDFTIDVLRKVDLPADDAALVARYLVDVDLRGVVSHGTRQLRRYVAEFREGRINPRPEIAQVMDAPSMAIFDGDGGAGYLVATQATEAVIEKAKANGIAVACTRNHGHVGSVGIYARLALVRDLATFSVAGGVAWEKPTEPDATVWDAMRAPPMCFGVPTAEGPPFVLDMNANMLKDRSKLAEALQTFPDFIFKSLGMRFTSWFLAGILAGTATPESSRPKFSSATRAFTIVAIDVARLGDLEAYKAELTRILRESRSLKPMPGLASAEVPGSLEWQREQTREHSGIPLTEDHLDMLQRIATEVNVPVPWES
ncbi:MAG: Ldh family oxidoreductase [Gemmatimonadetes bacterium]|nr:Ldh family oxidoreductase [Gemmatimonadota bacterium]